MKSNKPSREASPSSSQILWRLMQMSWSDDASYSQGACHIQSAGIDDDIQIGELKDASELVYA